jgi:hypothetical protein
MSELSPEARAIALRGARDDGPTTADRERVRAAIAAAIAGGAGIAATSSAAAATTAKTAASGSMGAVAAGTGIGVKVATVVALALGTGTGIYFAQRTETAPPAASRVEGRPAITVTREAPATPPGRAAAPAVRDVGPEEIGEGPVAIEAERASAAGTASRAPSEQATPSREALSPELDRERRLLDLAGDARAAGNPTRALELLDEHQLLFPAGQLMPEARAARVLALCDLGRADQARAAADDLRRAHPRSPLLPRIERSCAARQ